MPISAPYGTWKSPISAEILTKESIVISDVLVDTGKKATLYHAEDRPSEDGRTVIVETESNKDFVPAKWNVRTGVHEYGGRCAVIHNGVLFFSDRTSNRIHRVDSLGGTPVPVSPDNSAFRYGGLIVHPTQPHLVISILEDHTIDEPSKVKNTLVCVNTKTSTVTTLAEGADFYSFPAVTSDGKRLAFIRWYHPNMPWEASQLLTVDILASDDAVTLDGKAEPVAGGPGESISQPVWIDNNVLTFVSDSSGFYNPLKYDARDGSLNTILKTPLNYDFSEPDWKLGDYRIIVLNPSTLVVAPIVESVTQLSLLDVPSGKLTPIPSPYVNISNMARVSDNAVAFVSAQVVQASALILTTFVPNEGGGTPAAVFTSLKKTSDLSDQFPPELISSDVAYTLINPEDSSPLYALLASPKNPDYDPKGSGNELPPCIVHVHGGPTSRSPPGLAWLTQFFTSRGWAFCSVNYGGSSGYGRNYIKRLAGEWGVTDVDDCVSAVKLLGEKGVIDAKRVAIRGGSSGGYTALQALCTLKSNKTWAAAASLYGISDLVALASDTHKFESQYMYGLIGGTPEEKPELYAERSPLRHADNIVTPLLILQGDQDRVVPPNQSEEIVKAIEANGGKVKYRLFAGEGHGWKKAETIKEAMELELGWYEEVFKLGPGSK